MPVEKGDLGGETPQRRVDLAEGAVDFDFAGGAVPVDVVDVVDAVRVVYSSHLMRAGLHTLVVEEGVRVGQEGVRVGQEGVRVGQEE